MDTMLKPMALCLAFQIGLIVSATMLVPLSSNLPIVALMGLYLPTILLVSATANFTGCGNMIGPVIFGIPLGIVSYTILAGYAVRLVRFLRTKYPGN